MDITTSYLGLKLKNPIVPSASPLSKDLGKVKAMEDAGAAAIVMYSLFEEQLTHDALELLHYTSTTQDGNAEAVSYFPEPDEYFLGPEEYLKHLSKIKESVEIPVIGSLHGSTPGGWTEYAKNIEQAGADALELNIYLLAADVNKTSDDIEKIYMETLHSVKAAVSIPVAVKISPYFSSLAGFAKHLDENGADGLVLFNRFYQPDIDLENLEVMPNVLFSNPQSMRLPLRWIAILYGKIKADMAATSGIHSAEDVIKMMMVGAKITQMFAAIHMFGINHIKSVIRDIEQWMYHHEYESIEQMRGSMSHKSVANPGDFERANYMKALNTFK